MANLNQSRQELARLRNELAEVRKLAKTDPQTARIRADAIRQKAYDIEMGVKYPNSRSQAGDIIIPGSRPAKDGNLLSNKPEITVAEAFQRGRKYALDGQERGLDKDTREFFGLNKGTLLDKGVAALEEVGAAGMGAIRAGTELAKKAGIVDDADRAAGEISDLAMAAGVVTGMQPSLPRVRTPKRQTVEDVNALPEPEPLPADAPPPIEVEVTGGRQPDVPVLEEAPAKPKKALSPNGLFIENKRDPDGVITLSYRRSWKEAPIPIRMGIDENGMAEMSIDQFSTASNRLGPRAIREAMQELMVMYPEIKGFGGYRRSGAGAGRVQEIFPASAGGGNQPPIPPRGGGDGWNNEPPTGDPPSGGGPKQPNDPDKYIGNINVERLNSTDDVENLLRGIQEDIPEARAISHEETRARANELGMTEEEFLKSRGLEGLEAFAVRSRDLLRTVAEDTVRILEDAGDLESSKAQVAIARLATVSEHLQGTVNGPAGRILNSFKIGAERVNQAQTLAGAMATARGRRRVAKLLQQYRGDPDALAKIARDAVDPTIRDRIFSFRYNMMLSGPKTHVYNILGNTSNILVDLAEHGFASVIGQQRRWGGDLDRITGREVAARITGAVVGARRGLATMRQAYKEGRPLDDAARTEMKRGRVSSIEVPVKALAAEDEFFRSVADMSDTYGMAVRKAHKEGLTGEEFKERVRELIDDPTKDMLESSSEYAKRMRFQDDPSFIGQAIEQMRTHKKNDTLLTGLGRDGIALILPFVRTPDSLARTALRRSPLGVVEGKNIEDWKAGGARRDLAVSRVAMGSGIAAYIGMKALEGMVTGEGPRDYKKRQALELTGWQPNSIKVGDQYYSYEGLEPLSHLLSGISTSLERWDEGSEKGVIDQAARQVFNAAEVLTNSTWAEGLADLFSAMEAPESQRGAAINTFLANIAASFVVPAASRQVNQAYFDNITRDTRGDDSLGARVKGRIQSGIPGMSDDLPAQLDALGRPVGRGDAIGPDILSRASPPLAQNEPAAAELARLMKSDPEGKVLLERVDRSVNTKDFPMGRLSALEHHNYQLITGVYFTALMEEALASPEYQAMSDDEKREYVRELATDARKWAREEAFSDPNAPVEETSGDMPEDAEPTEAPAEDDLLEEEAEEFPFGIPTSMRRTEEGNREVGGVENSMHISGDAIDFVPAPGVSWEELVQEAEDFFGPEAVVIHEYPGTSREHVHVQLPGLQAPYYGARGTK